MRILQLESKISTERYEYDTQSAFSTSESGYDTEKESQKFTRKEKLTSTPTLLESLALCYLAMLTLRLPVTPGDIYKWTMEEGMPYKKAIKHIPPVMKDRLPAHYHASLNPNSVLKLDRFQSATTNLQISFEKEHGITWPGLNYPLLLFRYLKELALPLELYDATTRLAGILGYDFVLHTANKSRLGIRHLPEAQFLACLVVCTKLIYPFDEEQRNPKSMSEPAATKIDWEEWYKAITSARTDESDSIAKLTIEELTNLQEKDVFSMTGDQMDQYLDWYQDSFIDESGHEQAEDGEFRNALYSMFPIDTESSSNAAADIQEDVDDQVKLNIVKATHGTIEPVPVVEAGEETERTLRPGQNYPFYKTEKELPPAAKNFYEEAARIAGLPLGMLVKAVFYTEKAIQKWQKGKKKQPSETRELEEAL